MSFEEIHLSTEDENNMLRQLVKDMTTDDLLEIYQAAIDLENPDQADIIRAELQRRNQLNPS